MGARGWLTWTAVAGLVCGLWPQAAAAQAAPMQGDSQSAVQADQASQRPKYRGVTPGATSSKRKRRARNRVTWIGFQQRDDGSARVFVQLTSEATYTQEVRDGVLLVKLARVRYRDRNSRRRLDMRYFDTTLRQVTSRRVGRRRARRGRPAQSAGIELRLEFKEASDATEAQTSMEAGEDGYYYLFLDFNG